MTERRKGERSILPQRAQFFGKRGWEACLITDVSSNGMGVRFYTPAGIETGSIIHLKVGVPLNRATVTVKGVLRWVEHAGEGLVGGVEWFRTPRESRKESQE